MRKKYRNGYVDICRFIAAFCIVWFHFGKAPFIGSNGKWISMVSGGLFVEFFFMLTGYFAVAHMEKISITKNQNIASHIGKYMLQKYTHFLPYSLFTVLIQYAITFVIHEFTSVEIIKMLSMAPFEALLLRNTGINLAGANGTLWYLSAMLVTLPLVLYISQKIQSVFQNYLVWVLPLFLYGIVLHQIGTVRTTDWLLSNIRAAAGLLLGGSLYYITGYLRKVRISGFARTLLSLIEVGSFLMAIRYTMFRSLSKTYYDVFFILILFFSLYITLSGLSWTGKIQGAFPSFLGRISLPVYCFQMPVIHGVRYWMDDMSMGWQLLAVTVGTFLLACMMEGFIVRIFRPICHCGVKWVKEKAKVDV